jgi:glycosidase
VVYFLLVDRFSDGQRAAGHCSIASKLADARPDHSNGEPWRWDSWATSGSDRYQGGSLTGVTSKLDYLRASA